MAGPRATAWDQLFWGWGTRDDRRHARAGLRFGRDVHTGQCIIHAIAVTTDAPDVEKVRGWAEASLLRHPRFTQVLSGGRWVPAREVDLSRHVVAAGQLTGAGDPFAPGGVLEGLVQELIACPLDMDAPQWRLNVVGGGGSAWGGALVLQVSHGMADGISLAALLAAMVDGPEPRMPGGGLGKKSPEGAARAARQLLVAAWATLFSVGFLVWAYLVADTPCAIKAPRSRVGCIKRWGVSPPIPVARLRAVGRATGCTVNDVVMAMVAGAIERYLTQEAGAALGGAGAAQWPPRVRAMVAVNLRPVGDVIADVRQGLRGGAGGEAWARWGNLWGPVLVALPVGHPGGAMGALRSLHARMAREKGSAGPWVLQRANEAFGRVIGAERLEGAFRRIGGQASLVYSNVPGPVAPVSLAGLRAHLANIVTGSPHATQWNVLSYAGDLRVSTTVAASLVPDPHALLAGLEGALRELEAGAGLATD